jgi:hypothetical protein
VDVWHVFEKPEECYQIIKNVVSNDRDLTARRWDATSLQDKGSFGRDIGAEDSDVSESQETRPLSQLVEETVQRASSSYAIDDIHEASIEVAWQLQQCIRDELEGSPDLNPVLTISGNASHSWAVSCLGYVEATWGDLGRQLLGDLEIQLQKISNTTG